MSLILNSDQIAARDFVVRRLLAGEEITELAGAAGTGKTTMLRAVMDALQLPEFNPNWPSNGGVAVIAPTNKAAAVLRSKGFKGASTVHKATTRPLGKDGELVVKLEAAIEIAKNEGDKLRLEMLYQDLEDALNPTFTGCVTDWKLAHALILDEGSMVSEEMAENVFALGVPLLVVGDPFQLKPVGGTPRFLTNLNASHTVVLTKIERQAEGSGIIQLATALREGASVTAGRIDQSCSVIDLSDTAKQKLWASKASEQLYLGSDVVVTGTNKNRYRANRLLRKLRFGLDREDGPDVREPYITYTGVAPLGMYKNDIISLEDVGKSGLNFTSFVKLPADPTAKINDYKDKWKLYGGHLREHVKETGRNFAYHKYECERTAQNLEVDYAYALTAHRVQGSEFNSIMVLEDGFVRRMEAEERRRWLYTAVTRGKSKVVLVRNSPWH